MPDEFTIAPDAPTIVTPFDDAALDPSLEGDRKRARDAFVKLMQAQQEVDRIQQQMAQFRVDENTGQVLDASGQPDPAATARYRQLLTQWQSKRAQVSEGGFLFENYKSARDAYETGTNSIRTRTTNARTAEDQIAINSAQAQATGEQTRLTNQQTAQANAANQAAQDQAALDRLLISERGATERNNVAHQWDYPTLIENIRSGLRSGRIESTKTALDLAKALPELESPYVRNFGPGGPASIVYDALGLPFTPQSKTPLSIDDVIGQSGIAGKVDPSSWNPDSIQRIEDMSADWQRRAFQEAAFPTYGQMTSLTNGSAGGGYGASSVAGGATGQGGVAGAVTGQGLSGDTAELARSLGSVPINDPRQAFVAKYLPYAIEFERQTGVPANVTLAIGASESNWGKAGSIFGIKGSGPGGKSQNYATWEMVNGQPVQTRADFAVYDDPWQAFQHFGSLINNERYRGAPTSDPRAFAAHLQQRGYATDPQWADKIASLSTQVAPLIAQTLSQPGVPVQLRADYAEGRVRRAGATDPTVQGRNPLFDVAEKELGKPYVFGGGRNGDTTSYDCSSFVSDMYKRAYGINITPYTDAAAAQPDMVRVDPKDARPGDIVFYQYHDPSQPQAKLPHMGIWVDQNQVLDARYGQGVGYRPHVQKPGMQMIIMRPKAIHEGTVQPLNPRQQQQVEVAQKSQGPQYGAGEPQAPPEASGTTMPRSSSSTGYEPGSPGAQPSTPAAPSPALPTGQPAEAANDLNGYQYVPPLPGGSPAEAANDLNGYVYRPPAPPQGGSPLENANELAATPFNPPAGTPPGQALANQAWSQAGQLAGQAAQRPAAPNPAVEQPVRRTDFWTGQVLGPGEPSSDPLSGVRNLWGQPNQTPNLGVGQYQPGVPAPYQGVVDGVRRMVEDPYFYRNQRR